MILIATCANRWAAKRRAANCPQPDHNVLNRTDITHRRRDSPEERPQRTYDTDSIIIHSSVIGRPIVYVLQDVVLTSRCINFAEIITWVEVLCAHQPAVACYRPTGCDNELLGEF